jgi:hypothetical protein
VEILLPQPSISPGDRGSLGRDPAAADAHRKDYFDSLGDNAFLKLNQQEEGFRKRPDFPAMGLVLVSARLKAADLIIELARPDFTLDVHDGESGEERVIDKPEMTAFDWEPRSSEDRGELVKRLRASHAT